MQSLLVATSNMELQVEYDSHCQLCGTRLQCPYLQDKVLISLDDKKKSHRGKNISNFFTKHLEMSSQSNVIWLRTGKNLSNPCFAIPAEQNTKRSVGKSFKVGVT